MYGAAETRAGLAAVHDAYLGTPPRQALRPSSVVPCPRRARRTPTPGPNSEKPAPRHPSTGRLRPSPAPPTPRSADPSADVRTSTPTTQGRRNSGRAFRDAHGRSRAGPRPNSADSADLADLGPAPRGHRPLQGSCPVGFRSDSVGPVPASVLVPWKGAEIGGASRIRR